MIYLPALSVSPLREGLPGPALHVGFILLEAPRSERSFGFGLGIEVREMHRVRNLLCHAKLGS